MFDIANSTLRNWCHLAAPFLSDNATPPKSGHKTFTVDDIQILAVIKNAPNYDAAFVALKNGERGELPAAYLEYTIAARPQEQVMLLQTRVMQLEAQVETLQAEREARLRAEGREQVLQKQLDDAQETIIQLRIQLAKLTAGG